jgi:very-short-patch-repair endonuclease
MVIRHFKNPMPDATKAVDDLSSLCESVLEREVYGRLIALGYRVLPQVRAGGYRIDLVAEGEHDRRLAIELDGDKYHGPERWAEDFARQQTLERMGWRFWRCWGSSFVRDPDSCMSDLLSTLADLGIEPIGSDPRPNIFTQHVVVSAGDQAAATEEVRADDWVKAPEPTEPPPMPAAMPHIEAAQSPFIEIGDRVVVRFGETQNQRTLVLRRDGLDLDNGFITLEHPLGEALLNCSEDDEIEYEFDGKTRIAAILKVEKGSFKPGSLPAR